MAARLVPPVLYAFGRKFAGSSSEFGIFFGIMHESKTKTRSWTVN